MKDFKLEEDKNPAIKALTERLNSSNISKGSDEFKEAMTELTKLGFKQFSGHVFSD